MIHPLNEYLTFTKKERTGIITLLVIILLLVLAPLAFPFFIKEKTYSTAEFENDISRLKIKQTDSNRHIAFRNFDENNYQNFYQPSYKNSYYKNQPTGELFYFDPNTATTADWQRLGVRDKTIATIQNYLSKGGHFYKPEDIGKIWGLHEDEVERLLPYIQIAEKERSYADNYQPNTNDEKPVYEKKTYTPSVVDVNIADTSAFIALPGIGSKLAQRIIAFREKLGGFYKPEQVAETFGLPDSTFQIIKPQLTISNTPMRQLNINTTTVDELKTHPYIKYPVANAIIQYRAQHGNYPSVNELKNIMIIDEALFNKISPYLKVE